MHVIDKQTNSLPFLDCDRFIALLSTADGENSITSCSAKVYRYDGVKTESLVNDIL